MKSFHGVNAVATLKRITEKVSGAAATPFHGVNAVATLKPVYCLGLSDTVIAFHGVNAVATLKHSDFELLCKSNSNFPRR